LLEKPAISDTQLTAFLAEKYGLRALALEFLPWGNDANSWVYRVNNEAGVTYFLKLRKGPLYPPAFRAPAFFKAQGITEVAAPLPTTAQEIWTPLGDFTAVLYPFIEGDNGWNVGMSGQHWRELGAILKRIHALAPPSFLLTELRQEKFDLSEYLGWHELDQQLYIMKASSELEREFMAIWTAKRPIIAGLLNQMVKLAEILRTAALPLVICHADLHPGNVLIDRHDRLLVIDWDEVMLAPKERDFIFVDTASPDFIEKSPFFQGYGPVEINWPALAYYRYERVIQDVLAFAQEVFFRPDMGEENKASSVKWFGSIFGPGDEVEAALATIRQVPVSLIVI
jgi:spectinomycin phosphotransferase